MNLKLIVNQLTLSFASIYTTSSAICYILLDLIAYSEFITPFRKEIEQKPAVILRITTAPLYLSISHTIPKGTSVLYDSHIINLAGLNLSSLPYNPSIILKLNPPNILFPFRFSLLYKIPGNNHHACPGRFFTGVELKVVMVELLRHWDFRNIRDVKIKGVERPVNIVVGIFIHPHPAAQLEFKRRA
ncbi:uncharacterized protein EAF01_008637 [Botrytis porri]|uniref:uncharacterized protein n=1 Tax=Botrytis porri TaxID=87229 RepID=UPI001901C4E2|nr:uncharacterized protein EAF01_008637 [Botrytis porri]KAF7897671.1 hypothetical protein EAF01_008637 [Botrytis porri]